MTPTLAIILQINITTVTFFQVIYCANTDSILFTVTDYNIGTDGTRINEISFN